MIYAYKFVLQKGIFAESPIREYTDFGNGKFAATLQSGRHISSSDDWRLSKREALNAAIERSKKQIAENEVKVELLLAENENIIEKLRIAKSELEE